MCSDSPHLVERYALVSLKFCADSCSSMELAFAASVVEDSNAQLRKPKSVTSFVHTPNSQVLRAFGKDVTQHGLQFHFTPDPLAPK